MREIKFGGKRKDNSKWVKGNYIKQLVDVKSDKGIYKHFIVTGIDNQELTENGTYLRYFEVNPKTVGQYTGLKDKNGQEIYEGDIINKKYKLGNRYYLIKYDNKKACFVMKKLNRNKFEPNKIGTETRFYEHDWKNSEVIGNKYENPDLLE